MPVEIERKFLVANDGWRPGATGTAFRQGYISTDLDRVVRVRLEGNRGVFTIKSRGTGITRGEWEYEIPPDHAGELLDQVCLHPLIEKTRYLIDVAGHTWEVDEFHGDNAGLVVAEIELGAEGESFETPPWLGKEVTDDRRYLNASLVEKPYSTW